MSNQPPYGYPPQGEYTGGGYPPPPGGKTKVFGLDNNLAAMLCYLLVFCCCLNIVLSIILLATEPRENRLVRFHALQALLLAVAGILVSILFSFLGVGVALTPSDALAAGGGMILFLIRSVIGLVFLVFYIIAAVKAFQGEIWKIPMIGDIAEKNA